MRSSLVGGGQVSVQSARPERFGFPALQLSDYSVYPVVAQLLMTALEDHAEPWQSVAAEVDGRSAEVFVLDLASAALLLSVAGCAEELN